MKVAVIGLGRMGSGIARRLAAIHAGTRVFDLSSAKVRALADVAVPARSVREAVGAADLVVLSLLDDESVLGILRSDAGILPALPKGAVIVNATTISGRAAREAEKIVQEGGGEFLHGPVVGRPEAAADGTLRSFVAGSQTAYERVRPALKAYLASVIYVGSDIAAAARTKLLINYVAASLIDLMGQVFAFSEKAELDTMIIEGILKNIVPNPPFTTYCERIHRGDFDRAGFSLRLGLKDLDLMLGMSSEVEAPLPNAGPIHDRIIAAIAQGHGESDWSAWTLMSRSAAGLTPSGRPK